LLKASLLDLRLKWSVPYLLSVLSDSFAGFPFPRLYHWMDMSKLSKKPNFSLDILGPGFLVKFRTFLGSFFAAFWSV
jgi:hypothetical protein